MRRARQRFTAFVVFTCCLMAVGLVWSSMSSIEGADERVASGP
jgi:hypothetical protein